MKKGQRATGSFLSHSRSCRLIKGNWQLAFSRREREGERERERERDRESSIADTRNDVGSCWCQRGDNNFRRIPNVNP